MPGRGEDRGCPGGEGEGSKGAHGPAERWRRSSAPASRRRPPWRLRRGRYGERRGTHRGGTERGGGAASRGGVKLEQGWAGDWEEIPRCEGVRRWNRSHGEAVDFPSLEVFKAGLDGAGLVGGVPSTRQGLEGTLKTLPIPNPSVI